MAKTQIKCVIFDMDNTILQLDVDWDKLKNEINWDFFKGNYSHLTPQQFFVTHFKELLKKLSPKQQAEVKRKRLETELSGIPKEKCFPYVHIIAELKKKGYKLAVVSANYRLTVKKALAKCGIDRYITVFVAIDDSKYSKPSPKPIQAALRKLKCKPYEAVYVGDQPDDIRAGKAAGMKTIGVASSLGKHVELTLAGPDTIIKNVGDLAEGLMKIYG